MPLIESITYENDSNTIIFNIKPNEKGTLLVGNRKNAGTPGSQTPNDKGEIIIDLSSSPLYTQLANWDPSATSGTTIAFVHYLSFYLLRCQ